MIRSAELFSHQWGEDAQDAAIELDQDVQVPGPTQADGLALLQGLLKVRLDVRDAGASHSQTPSSKWRKRLR